MKLIIDITKEHYERIKWVSENGMGDSLQKKVINGTPIPDNATNGDIMQTMFPNADIEIHNITVYVIFDMRSNVISFDLDWWNAPYQKGGKE